MRIQIINKWPISGFAYVVSEFVNIEILQLRLGKLIDGIFDQNGNFRYTNVIHQLLQLYVYLESFRILSNVGNVEVVFQFKHLNAKTEAVKYKTDWTARIGNALPCKWSHFDGTTQLLGTTATVPYSMLDVTSIDVRYPKFHLSRCLDPNNQRFDLRRDCCPNKIIRLKLIQRQIVFIFLYSLQWHANTTVQHKTAKENNQTDEQQNRCG